MEKQNIVVVGSSAGGVMALKELVSSFPKNFEASICIVQHLAADANSQLPSILSAAGSLPAVNPKDGQKLQPGHIYIAPADRHMILFDEQILVKKGPKENRFRPSIDVLMRSAAIEYGPRVIGVVLTGRLSDGTSGLWSVREMGGITITQSPQEALYPQMPQSVLDTFEVDYVLPIAEIGALIVRLVNKQPNDSHAELNEQQKKQLHIETEIAAQRYAFDSGIREMGQKTDYTCPECGGALVGIKEGCGMRYRCHTGHGFSAQSLMTDIVEVTEINVWSALRSVEEGIMLMEQSATQAHTTGQPGLAEDFSQKSQQLRAKSKLLLDFLYDNKNPDTV
ncbi:chemotaxis protein CheB [Arundinibacter roseus]|uniref:protein-glutamate methylesterase n=1 Tax=Arundinibacter roseus TaxID=2070510 RepID=A0A4V2XAH2_9BACT|nr:chemotaxis protein CheB [Arundinibacter roseus]TDB67555.1 chemotaxis protein CheB [Arundinibacter roseus]